MLAVLCAQIRRLAEHVDSDHNGLINYHEFSRAFKITDVKDAKRREGHGRDEDPGWADRIIQQMSNFLFQYRLELASMFRAFDVNNDGTISRQEFKVLNTELAFSSLVESRPLRESFSVELSVDCC